MTRSSSVTKVSNLIAKIDSEQENTVRQKLKEWYKSAAAKARPGNKEADVISSKPGSTKRLSLLMARSMFR